ncbi:MAG: type II secretion system F family protein [Gemmataceae bacterium]|jgi:tight adherence protein C
MDVLNQWLQSPLLQNEWTKYVLLGLAVMAVPLALYVLFRPRVRKVTVEEAADDASQHELVLGDMTQAFAGQLPGGDRDREQLMPLLRQGGFYRRTALIEYQAVRAMLVLTPLVIGVAAALLVDRRYTLPVLLGSAMAAVVGFAVPRVYLSVQAGKRVREIERGLPVFADLTSIALLAGQSLLASIQRATDQLRPTFPGLATELDIVLAQADLLSLSVAFEQWADRSQMQEIRNIAVILTQSQRLGNDPSAVLMEFATNMRINLRQRADAQAQRTTFLALFPTILFLWLPALVLLVGPVYFDFAEKRKASREALDSVSEQLKQQQADLFGEPPPAEAPRTD